MISFEALEHMHLSKRVLIVSCLVTGMLHAQPSDSVKEPKSHWEYLLLADFYYGFDFARPASDFRQAAFCSYNRHHTPALNAGIAKISHYQQRFQLHLGVLGGTYSTDNYANEPGLFKHIFEANVAIKLLPQKNLWLRLGAFPSHIGFESAIANENHTLTRSLLAENSPYYISGAQLRYETRTDWKFALLLLNGWQRLHWPNNQRRPSWGTQVQRTTAPFTFNWSSFTGTIDPDTAQQLRSFHNFYSIFNIHRKWQLTLGFDLGWQQQAQRWSQWYSPVGIVRYQANSHWGFAGRTEYYHDPHAAQLRFTTPNGFTAWGFSANVDRNWSGAGLLRAEIRYLYSPNAALNPLSRNQRQNLTMMLAAVVRLDGTFQP